MLKVHLANFDFTNPLSAGERAHGARVRILCLALLAFLLTAATSRESTGIAARTKSARQSAQKSPNSVEAVSGDANAELGQLKADVSKTKEALSELKTKVDKPPKDIWDKLSAISGLLSGVLIALFGIYATQAFNRRQLAAQDSQKARELSVLEVQTVEKFFPHLASNDNKSRTAALLSIAALGNEALATKLARIFADVGSREALSKIASSFASDAKQGAESALADLFSTLKASVVMVMVKVQSKSVSGTGYFVESEGLLVTSAHVVAPMGLTESDPNLPGPIQIRTFDGNLLEATILSINLPTETAVLRATVSNPVSALRFRQSPIEIGASAIAVGMIFGKWEARTGQVVGVEVSFSNHSGLIAVQMDTGPGFSGAPVIDVEGCLIGMGAYSDGAGTAYLVPVSQVITQLQPYLSEIAVKRPATS